MQLTADDCELDAHFFDTPRRSRRNLRVGNDMVNLFHIGDFAEATTPELRRIGENNSLLRCLHHHTIKHSLHHVGGRNAEVEVDAVDTYI